MVKFMIKGDNVIVRMCGHSYQGNTIYDNNFCKLPLDVIKPYIIGEDKSVEAKKEEVVALKATEEELLKLTKAEQVALLKEKGLSDKEIKALSSEVLRVARLLELGISLNS